VYLIHRIQEKYDLHEKLGTGKYSFVFEGFDIMQRKEVILKVLKHSNLDKIHREILTLNAVKDKSPYLASLVDYGKEELDGAIVLVILLHECESPN
jgi:serine/threonine protein kinase